MLSDDAIDKLIQPIIDRQESINTYIISEIAKKIKEVGEMSPSDLYKLQTLIESGASARKINRQLALLTGLQEAQIRQIIRVVAKDAYEFAKPFYDYRYRPFVPFAKNTALQRMVVAMERQTAGAYRNLSNASAFMIRDLKNPQILKPTLVSEVYQSVIDEAVQMVYLGTVDYETAMRRTLQQLVDSGIRVVTYQAESGKIHTQRLDTAVRRNLLGAVRQMQQQVQDYTGEQFGADGKELSAHPYSAPDHEPFQGRQFTNENWNKIQNHEPFVDIHNRHYSGVERIIGQYNCRHVAWSIIIGEAKPNYTDEQLDAFIKKNHEGYTLPNGKHLTMYECTQRQRALETKIRKAKDGQIAARRAGDMVEARNYQAKINKYTNEYTQFSKACGLQQHNERMTVSGYRKISTR